ncbi:conjugal transfer protein TraO, partial [Phocaeicola vulgatus]
MKRLLFIILLFGVCLTFNRAHAQRCLPGMRGIQLTGGLSDNMRWKNGDGFGYHAGIAVSTYTKNAHHWVVGAEYLEKRYGYRDCLYPASQFTGEGGYYLNFLSDRKKMFFAALGLSALAGYETVNWGESLLPDGSRLTDEDNFIYGGALTLELSAYVTDKIVLLVNGRQ